MKSDPGLLTRLYQDAIKIGFLTISYIFIIIALLSFIGYLIVRNIVGPTENLLEIFLRDIAFVCFPVALFTILHYYHLQDFQDKKLEGILDQSFGRYLGCETMFKEIKGIYPERIDIINKKYFESAKKEIDILVTNLSYLCEHGCLDTLIKLAKNKKKKKLKIRILAMDPENDFIEKRFGEVAYRKAKLFKDNIADALIEFCKEKKKSIPESQKNRFKILTFEKNPPSIVMFRVDDRLVIGFLLRQNKSRYSLHIEFDCSKSEGSAKGLIEHFESILIDCEEVNLEKLQEKYDKK